MTLVFLHGAGCDGSVFDAQVAAFPGSVALTLPGHAQQPGYPSSIAEFADAVEAELAALDATPVLCGHSMGGAIALEIALRGRTALRGVVLLDAGARMRVAPAFLEAMERDFPSAARAFAELFFAQPSPALLEGAVTMLLACGQAQTLRDLRSCDAFDATDRLDGLAVPLAAIAGEADRLTPPKLIHALADRVRSGQARILPDAGHFPMLEVPEATNAALRAFVDQLHR